MLDEAEIIQKVIRSRVTEKVMCDLEFQEIVPAHIEEPNRKLVRNSIETAGWAPFHYSRGCDEIAEPWRAHILWNLEVRKAAHYLLKELKVTTKEPKLAAACSALVIVTWLPEPSASQGHDAKVNLLDNLSARNEEHLAASSAMVQNLLLMLTACGMGTYWSSGGRFRSPEMFEYLKIPQNERLLAAIFIEYPEVKTLHKGEKQRKPGAQRNNRSHKWIREV